MLAALLAVVALADSPVQVHPYAGAGYAVEFRANGFADLGVAAGADVSFFNGPAIGLEAISVPGWFVPALRLGTHRRWGRGRAKAEFTSVANFGFPQGRPVMGFAAHGGLFYEATPKVAFDVSASLRVYNDTFGVLGGARFGFLMIGLDIGVWSP